MRSLTLNPSPSVKKADRNETLANLSALPPETIEVLRKSLKGAVLIDAEAGFEVERSVPHGDAAAERIISWTATQNGRRIRLRYLGTARNDAWLHTRCAAINLRTLLRHGLTRRDGSWVLD